MSLTTYESMAVRAEEYRRRLMGLPNLNEAAKLQKKQKKQDRKVNE